MKNNDTFTIRPLEWIRAGSFRLANGIREQYLVREAQAAGRWVASLGMRDPVWSVIQRTEEAAMAACEQHWRSEIEPALVRVENGRDALLARALEAIRSCRRYIRHEETCCSKNFYVAGPCDCGRIEAVEENGKVVAEIEKALPVAKPEPQST